VIPDGGPPLCLGRNPCLLSGSVFSQYSCGFWWLFLRIGHGLKALEKQPLGHAAGKTFVGCDVAYLVADVDVGNDDFGGVFLVLPVAVDAGDG